MKPKGSRLTERALEAENLRLHRTIASLKAQLISARNGVLARLENTPPDELSDAELTQIIRQKSKSRRGKKKN